MDNTRYRLIVIALMVEGLVLCTALLLSHLMDVKLFPLTDNLFRDIALGTIAALIPFAFFLLFVSEIAGRITILADLRRKILMDIKGLFANSGVLDILFISLIAGFSEELLFRGVIQARYGLIIASVIFGALHFVTFSYAVAAVVAGFYIGGLFIVFDSLLIPVQLHFIYDFLALLYLRYFIKEEPGRLETSDNNVINE